MGLTFNLGRVSPSVFTDSSLNVGIGAAPSGSYKLEVTGTAKVSSTLLVSGAATFSSTLLTGGDITVSKSGDSGINLNSTTTNGVAVTRYKTTAAGNLWGTGINITAADSRWEVYNFTLGASPFILSNAGAATFTTTQTTGTALTINVDAGSGTPTGLKISAGIAAIGAGAKLIQVINSAGDNLFNVLKSGYVGIGVSPSYMLHVQGNLSSSQSLFYNTINAGTEANLLLRLGSNCSNTNSTYISGGIFGVADKFYIYGNGNMVNANNSYGPLSDIKLKENIKDATPKLDKLMQVRIVNYNLISDPDLKQIGVVAQELEKVFPGLVDEHIDKDEEGNLLDTTTKSVKMSVFVPMLIKAMQEQQLMITSLQDRLDKAGL